MIGGGSAGGFGNLFGAVGGNSFSGGQTAAGTAAVTSKSETSGFLDTLMGLFDKFSTSSGKESAEETPEDAGGPTRIEPNKVRLIKDLAATKFPELNSLLDHSASNVRTGNTFSDAQGQHSALTAGVQDPRLNDGRETLIPTVWDGRKLTVEDAVQRALDSPRKWPSFDSPSDSTLASKFASRMMGVQ